MNILQKLFTVKTRAERNERNYQKWLRAYVPQTTSQRIELTAVFTDRNDNNFYILKNAGNLTRERANRIEESLLAIDYGIGKPEIIEKLNEILLEVDGMPWQSMTRERLREFHTKSKDSLSDILYRLKNIKIDELIIEAAMYFLFIDNENPYIINSDTIQKKRDLISTDEELRSFFLNSMEQILKGLSGLKS